MVSRPPAWPPSDAGTGTTVVEPGTSGNPVGASHYSSLFVHTEEEKHPDFCSIIQDLTEGEDHVRSQQTYDLGRSARLQRPLRVCRSLQHGEARRRIRECPGLYQTNDRFHSD